MNLLFADLAEENTRGETNAELYLSSHQRNCFVTGDFVDRGLDVSGASKVTVLCTVVNILALTKIIAFSQLKPFQKSYKLPNDN